MRCTFSNCLFLNFLKLFTLFATASIARKKLGQVPPPSSYDLLWKKQGGVQLTFKDQIIWIKRKMIKYIYIQGLNILKFPTHSLLRCIQYPRYTLYTNFLAKTFNILKLFFVFKATKLKQKDLHQHGKKKILIKIQEKK